MREITYAQFGRNFIRYVVTKSRLREEIEQVMRESIDGMVHALPANLVVAAYAFRIEEIDVHGRPEASPLVSFFVSVHGELDLDVKVWRLNLRYTLDVDIRIAVDVKTFEPLYLRLLPNPVDHGDILIDIHAHSGASRALDRLRLVQPFIHDRMVREVNRHIGSDEIGDAATIDVLEMARAVNVGDGPGEAG